MIGLREQMRDKIKSFQTALGHKVYRLIDIEYHKCPFFISRFLGYDKTDQNLSMIRVNSHCKVIKNEEKKKFQNMIRKFQMKSHRRRFKRPFNLWILVFLFIIFFPPDPFAGSNGWVVEEPLAELRNCLDRICFQGSPLFYMVKLTIKTVKLREQIRETLHRNSQRLAEPTGNFSRIFFSLKLLKVIVK